MKTDRGIEYLSAYIRRIELDTGSISMAFGSI
jgi:hypothetical protein